MKPERIEELRQAAKDAIHNGGRVTLEANELLSLLPRSGDRVIGIQFCEPKGPAVVEDDSLERGKDSAAAKTEEKPVEPTPVAPEEPKPVIQ